MLLRFFRDIPMTLKALFSLTLCGVVVVSTSALTGCSTTTPAPAVEPAKTALASVTRIKEPQRVTEVQIIEHVTCDPVRAKALQAKFDKIEAAQRAAGMPMADDYLKNYKPGSGAQG